MREIKNLGGEQEVVAAEMGRFFPHVAVAVQPRQGDVVTFTDAGLVVPDCGSLLNNPVEIDLYENWI